MTSIDEIILFVKSTTGTDEVKNDTDIFEDLGCVGDDFHELIEDYTKKYSVNMDGYLWYFHSDEEGHSIGSFFFTPPYRLVKRIPVTPQLLYDFAITGIWQINYPVHKLPKFRFDLLINLLFLIFFIFFLIKSCLK